MKCWYVVLLVSIFACAILAAPPTPVFPSAGRTGFHFVDTTNRTEDSFGEWHFSTALNAERTFAINREFYAIDLRLYDTKKHYVVHINRDRQSKCFISAETDKLDLPVFTDYKFVRTFNRDGYTLDEWNNAAEKTDYIDVDKTEVPVEFRTNTSFLSFPIFEVGPQPSNIFDIPKECNGAIPVLRKTSNLLGGCSLIHKIECAGHIAECAAECCMGDCVVDPACIVCLAGAYETCKHCF